MYSFEVRVAPDEGLEDVGVEKERFGCYFLAEVVQKLPALLDVALLGIVLHIAALTAVLLDGMGGI